MLFRATLTAALAATAFGASAPALTDSNSPASNECEKYSKGDGLKTALCPVFAETTGVLFYQANNINTNADEILKVVSKALGGNTNPLGQLATLATSGLVSNVAYAAGVTLYGLGATVGNLAPQCKCDLSLCYDSLQAANSATSVQSATSQAACANARYACSDYYQEKDIVAAAPGCANLTGTTSSRLTRKVRA